ncbi:MAG: DUF177 domain-containing protein [Verrucomicrobia bacterium]|nr:DUF177 domain-containing protein [Verrucomicrobiota bacterium]
MPILFNLRHLERKALTLAGELPIAELDVEGFDELIHPRNALRYDLHVEQLGDSVLVQGSLELALDCECVRCLRAFRLPLTLGDWTCLLPLTGAEQVPRVNDCVDLTPWVREDILLAFPQHPLCHPECRGLPAARGANRQPASGARSGDEGSSAWAELNKLKL